MLKRVTYSHALRAPKPWPSSPLSVTAAAISTPSTLRTNTISSVVLNADLVSFASVVRRVAFAPAGYLGAFVVGSVVAMMELSNLVRNAVGHGALPRGRGDRFASPADAPVSSSARAPV